MTETFQEVCDRLKAEQEARERHYTVRRLKREYRRDAFDFVVFGAIIGMIMATGIMWLIFAYIFALVATGMLLAYDCAQLEHNEIELWK